MSKFACSLLLAVVGCSGATSGSLTDAQQKLAAANARANGTATGDVCAQRGWYGDGVCDTFCTNTDTDCAPKPGTGTPVVCAQFIEVGDGVCGRSANDACRFQDPDCTDPGTGSGGTTGSGGATGSGGSTGGTACALISEVSDGKCNRAESDPCRFQDPDCGATSGGVDCDTRKVTCQTFAAVTCPEGQVPSVMNQCYGPCVDRAACAPIACDASLPAADGTCPNPATDPCWKNDPDCASGSGGSSGGAGQVDCNPSQVTDPLVQCPPDEVPSVVMGHYGACVSKTKCVPVACAAYIEISDGVCRRTYNDPCRGQDPDCSPY
jgi:hypothetical protein